MKNLFLTFRDGTSSLLSVPDDFSPYNIDGLMKDNGGYWIDTFPSGDDQIGTITIAIRGNDIRTAVLTEGGHVHAQPQQQTATGSPPEPLFPQPDNGN